MFYHASREGRRGFRFWWHIKQSVLHIEGYWWGRACHAYVDVDDEGWGFSVALPPFAVYLNLSGFGLWTPQKKCVATWDNNRAFFLTDQRECRFAIHDWKIWLTPWGRSMEWNSRDLWWIKGVTLDLKNLVAGKWRVTRETLRDGIPVSILMPEGVYHGTAKVERMTWKRPRWFTHSRVSTWIDVPKGIPFQGKGENSWDCGDDGLVGSGCEGESVEKAIAHFKASVEEKRRRYDHPSEQAIQEAMATA